MKGQKFGVCVNLWGTCLSVWRRHGGNVRLPQRGRKGVGNPRTRCQICKTEESETYRNVVLTKEFRGWLEEWRSSPPESGSGRNWDDWSVGKGPRRGRVLRGTRGERPARGSKELTWRRDRRGYRRIHLSTGNRVEKGWERYSWKKLEDSGGSGVDRERLLLRSRTWEDRVTVDTPHRGHTGLDTHGRLWGRVVVGWLYEYGECGGRWSLRYKDSPLGCRKVGGLAPQWTPGGT